jgi:hypothetical protein
MKTSQTNCNVVIFKYSRNVCAPRKVWSWETTERKVWNRRTVNALNLFALSSLRAQPYHARIRELPTVLTMLDAICFVDPVRSYEYEFVASTGTQKPHVRLVASAAGEHVQVAEIRSFPNLWFSLNIGDTNSNK